VALVCNNTGGSSARLSDASERKPWRYDPISTVLHFAFLFAGSEPKGSCDHVIMSSSSSYCAKYLTAQSSSSVTTGRLVRAEQNGLIRFGHDRPFVFVARSSLIASRFSCPYGRKQRLYRDPVFLLTPRSYRLRISHEAIVVPCFSTGVHRAQSADMNHLSWCICSDVVRVCPMMPSL
jgi:hypothetical protein